MPNRPNILLIMADQLTPFLTGAYDHPVVQTPNLDRLAGASTPPTLPIPSARLPAPPS